MIPAVAVENIYSINGIEFMLFCISAIRLRNTGVEAAAEKCGQTGFCKFFAICPLPAVVEISRKALFFAAFFVYFAPFGIVGILRLIIRRVHIVHAAYETSVHDGQILIGERDIHD